MPKRASKQKKRRGNKKPNRHQRHNNRNSNTNNSYSVPNDDILVPSTNNEEQLPNIPLPNIAKMLQQKISQFEQSKIRKDFKHLLSKNQILNEFQIIQKHFPSYINTATEMNTNSETTDIKNNTNTSEIPSETPSETAVTHDHCQQSINALSKLIKDTNTIFYQIYSSEQQLTHQSTKLITQNKTLTNLCQKINNEKKSLNLKLLNFQKNENQWKIEIEQKFNHSLEDIRDKISLHENKYDLVLNENKELHQKLEEFLAYDKKRNEDIENFKTHQTKLNEFYLKDKECTDEQLQIEKENTLKLQLDMKQNLNINLLLKKNNNEYEKRFKNMNNTLKQSSKCIEEYKNMNQSVMQQNRECHGRINDLVQKYKSLSVYNAEMVGVNCKSVKKIEMLSDLCRKLQNTNKLLKREMDVVESKIMHDEIVEDENINKVVIVEEVVEDEVVDEVVDDEVLKCEGGSGDGNEVSEGNGQIVGDIVDDDDG